MRGGVVYSTLLLDELTATSIGYIKHRYPRTDPPVSSVSATLELHLKIIRGNNFQHINL